MTAIPPNHEPAESVRGVIRACVAAIDGRRATRALAAWCERFALNEPEFQVLSCLRGSAGRGLDQTMLARCLAYSPAQVSTTVERLRMKGWIEQQAADGDRRRHVWQLTDAGDDTVAAMLSAAHELHGQCSIANAPTAAVPPRREAA